jgi:lysophospholipase L1-like esterase
MKILLVGDSISMGYTPVVQQLLGSDAEVIHNPGNGGDSDNMAVSIRPWLAAVQPDAVVLNCGLHDLKRERDSLDHQVPLDAYRTNLSDIVTEIDGANCKLLWVNTTPVIDERHNTTKEFDRHNVDVTEYNAMALAVMEEAEVAVLDLNAAVHEMGPEELLGTDGVHFTDDGYVKLGEVVAQAVREHLMA